MTQPALRLDAVSGRSFRQLTCVVFPGQVATIVCPVEQQRAELWDVITGLRAPLQGQVWLAGEDLYGLDEAQRLRVLRRVGVVSHDGGLISNLRVWENVMLPVWYHRGADAATQEEVVAALLHELAIEPEAARALMSRLPEHLNAGERVAAATIRALLMEPEVLIYDAPFMGVDRATAARLLRVFTQFQRARADRTSVYLFPDETSAQRVAADVALTVED